MNDYITQPRYQRILTAVAIVLWAVLPTQPATAATLTLVTSNYPPFSYEEDHSQKGIAVDIVREVFARMNEPIKIVALPFPRAVSMIKNGEADAIFPFAMSNARKQFVTYPFERLITDPGTLFVRADSDIVFDGDYSKLAKYSIGMQRGTDHGPVFMKALTTFNVRVDEAIDQEQNIQKLAAGRFDIAVGPQLVVRSAAKRIGLLPQIKVLYSGISEGDAYVGFSKKRDYRRLIERFNQTIKKMHEDGSYNRLVRTASP
jgi:polar amino acid transport system substrate-binding protein